MSAQARHLRVIDTHTGEALPECPACADLKDQLAGAERDIRSWRSRFAMLKRDKEREAQEHPAWPEAVAVFEEWKQACRHRSAGWTPDRFWLIEPYLRQHGLELCLRAVAGAAFDPYTTSRRNGTVKRHDGWELIFRDSGKFEDFANRAPREWAP